MRGAAAVREWTPAARPRRRGDDAGARPRRWPTRSRPSTPPCEPPWRRPPAGPALVHEAQRREDAHGRGRPTGGTVTERWVPVRRVGLYVPGGLVAYPSSVVMNVVPAQVAGVGSLAVASPPQRDNDGLPHPVVLAACALLGVDEVHAVGGAQAIAMFAYGTEDCEPTDLVTGPGNVYVASAKRLLRGRRRHRRRGRPDRDRHPRRRHRRPRLRRRRPGRAGRARRQRLLPAGHAEPRRCSTTVDAELAQQVAGDPAPRAGRDGAARPVGLRPGRRPRAGPRRRRRVGRRAPRGASPATRARWADRVAQRRRRLRRPVRAGVARRLPRRLQPRAADRRHRPAHRRAVGAVVPAQRARRRVHARRAGRGRAARSTPSAAPRTWPPTSTRCGRASRDERERTVSELGRDLLRADLRGRTPYGAPQLDVAVRLNTNENPHPPSAELVADLSAARRRGGPRDEPLPRPGGDGAARRPGGLPHPDAPGEPLDVEQVWAANGSNEVLQQLLQAFGGPGRTALGFEPDVLDAPADLRRAPAPPGPPMPRLPGFRLEPRAAAALVVREHAARRRVPLLAQQPDRDRARPRRDRGGLRRRARPGGRRRGVRRVLAPGRRRSPCCPAGPRLVVTRTMSKAFAFAAARLGYLAADPAVVDALQLVRLPYHLSVLTQAAARAALAHADELLATVGGRGGRAARPAGHRDPRRWGSRSSSRTRTSCCSASSATRRRPGRVCSTAACWCATWAWPAGCGSPRAPRPRPRRSSTRCARD